MAITVARYTFQSWLRKGIGNNINEVDNLSTGTSAVKERATVPVDININSSGVHKNFALLGPGDVIGINPHVVVRTSPRNWVTNYEPNYLPFIEFYDEDFPWRYTPAKANGDKLRPWIILLVLKDHDLEDKREFVKHDNRFPLPVVVVKSANNLPPVSESWAWAHVHINEGYNNASEFEQFLQSLHNPEDPNADKIISRLMCPRNLEPNTGYRAFVVPAFETGRLAGLGQEPKDVDAQKPSWTASSDNIEFPVYYEWYFRTGEDQDFESLVKLLEPLPMDKRVGIREMDGSKPGFGMTNGTEIGPITGPDGVKTVIGLEGALKAPTTKSRPETLDLSKPFFGELQTILNLPVTIQAASNTSTEDPVVCPPIYGENHARTHEVDFTKGGWLNNLNKDPRNRVPGGFGTNVVQKNQENYVARAWAQVKKILEANKKILFTNVAMQFAHINVSRFVAKLPAGKTLAVLSPLMKKVKGSPTTLYHQMKDSTLPPAAVSTALRKIIRPRGATFRRLTAMESRFNHAQLVADFAEGKVTAAPPKQVPPSLNTVDDLGKDHPSKNINQVLRWLLKNALLLFVLFLVLLFIILLFTGAWLTVLVLAIAATALYLYARQKKMPLDFVEGLSDPSKLTEPLQQVKPPKDFALVLTDEQLTNTAGNTTVVSALNKTSSSPDAVEFATYSYHTPVAGGATSLEAENFRKASIQLAQRLSIRATTKPIVKYDLANAHSKLLNAINPAVVFPKQLASSVIFAFNPLWLAKPENLVPAMAYPDFEDPMYEKLRDISPELLIPNLDLIPPNSISLMITNPPFIESYMVGLNHEFGRELLWREYPTDQRGSYFRQFWDVKGIITNYDKKTAEALVEDMKDIVPIDQWPSASELGTHKKIQPPGKQVVLVVRGELLKRYPNTIIYAQKAHLKNKDGKTRLDGEPVIYEVETEAEMKTEIKFPLFKAEIDPDLRFFGFDLTVEQARGDEDPQTDSDDWGWYFIIQEVPGEPKFGMDLYFEDDGDSTTPLTWDDLSWTHFSEGLQFVSTVTKPNFNPSGGDSLAQWGAHAANMAYILYQKPVMIAVHAKEMLEKL